MSLDIKPREFMQVDSNAQLGDTSISVAFRIKTTSRLQWEVVSRHDVNNTSQNGFGFSSSAATPNRIGLYTKPSTSFTSMFDASVDVSDGNWHSVVGRMVRTGSPTTDLMVDGTSATQVVPGAWSSNSNHLRIGRSLDTFWADFTGEIADLAWWGVRLTADEARSYCNGCAPGSIRPASLKLWMPLRGLYGA